MHQSYALSHRQYRAVFFSHRPKRFWYDQQKLSHFHQNVWKYRLKTLLLWVLIQLWDKWPKCFSGQNFSEKMTEMSQRKNRYRAMWNTCTLHSKDNNLWNKLTEVQLSAKSFKILFGLGLFNHFLPKIVWYCLATVSCLHCLCKSHIQWGWCCSLQYNLKLIYVALQFLSLPFCIYPKMFDGISE